MESVRNWLLPALLGAGYPVLVLGYTADLEIQLTRVELAATIAASLLAAAALGFRRRAPVLTLCVVTVVMVLGQLPTPDEYVVLPAEVVALYSVAVRCRPAIAWRSTGGLLVVTTLALPPGLSSGTDFAVEAVGNLLMYLVVLGLGRKRQRRLVRRDEAARRLQAAEKHRRDAAAIERRRLARELHDVSAHLLTSIVVSCGAAERLLDRQPELAESALTFAARTGREVLASLHRLVAVLGTGERAHVEPPAGRIAELAQAFGRLGQQVQTEVDPALSGPSAEAVFGIVRESLTNTLRYAPGAAVHVVVRQQADRILVLVDNGRSANIPQAAEGGGRGIAGMRERAEAAGGALTAGPTADGGWQVRADLPAHSQPSTPPPGGKRRRKRWLTEFAVALAVVAMPLMFIADALATQGSPSPGAATSLALLLSFLPGLTLLGRRERSWTTLVGVTIAAWLWPAAIAMGLLPISFEMVALVALSSVGAHAAAVYAVAVYGGGPGLTWWSVPAAAVGYGAAGGGLPAVVPFDDEPYGLGDAVGLTIFVACLMAIPLLACWGVGVAVRRRRRSRGGGEVLPELVRAAEAVVHGERRRIAAGLQHSVLARTGRMVAEAEAGSLNGVVSEARSALTAMRELLETLHETGIPAPRAPQLTRTAP